MELSNIDSSKIVIVIVGPTAVGKSDLAIEVAKYFKAEILSGDSRQCYKEIKIGTAKPNDEQLRTVKHHFIDNLSIHDFYSAGRYESDALALLETLFKKSPVAVLVGGSGMYIDAVCKGFNPMPETPEKIRQYFKALLNEKGLEFLLNLLKAKDQPYYDQVDRTNPQRIVRALEVIHFTGKRFSDFSKGSLQKRPFKIVKIGLNLDRELLYKRIDSRMDKMIQDGLFDEAEELYQFRDLYALQTVGYNEIFGFIDGKYDRLESIRLLKRNSRRYAKRQLTWFKRDADTRWFKPQEKGEIIRFLGENMTHDILSKN